MRPSEFFGDVVPTTNGNFMAYTEDDIETTSVWDEAWIRFNVKQKQQEIDDGMLEYNHDLTEELELWRSALTRALKVRNTISVIVTPLRMGCRRER